MSPEKNRMQRRQLMKLSGPLVCGLAGVSISTTRSRAATTRNAGVEQFGFGGAVSSTVSSASNLASSTVDAVASDAQRPALERTKSALEVNLDADSDVTGEIRTQVDRVEEIGEEIDDRIVDPAIDRGAEELEELKREYDDEVAALVDSIEQRGNEISDDAKRTLSHFAEDLENAYEDVEDDITSYVEEIQTKSQETIDRLATKIEREISDLQSRIGELVEEGVSVGAKLTESGDFVLVFTVGDSTFSVELPTALVAELAGRLVKTIVRRVLSGYGLARPIVVAIVSYLIEKYGNARELLEALGPVERLRELIESLVTTGQAAVDEFEDWMVDLADFLLDSLSGLSGRLAALVRLREYPQTQDEWDTIVIQGAGTPAKYELGVDPDRGDLRVEADIAQIERWDDFRPTEGVARGWVTEPSHVDAYRYRGDLDFEFLEGNAYVFRNGELTNNLVDEGFSNLLTIVGKGTETQYDFTVDGKLAVDDDIGPLERWDDRSGQSVTGWVTKPAHIDAFQYAGSLTNFEFLSGDAEVYLNGRRVTPVAGDLVDADSLLIRGEGEKANYEFSVSGVLEVDPSVGPTEPWDDVSDQSANGWVTSQTQVDAFYYTGEITQFDFLEGSARTVLNGTAVPSEGLGSQ